ncbi:MAG: sorting domain protein [Verrucomicrobiaceae bacterium]|nr:sorting domain protein [Verrucomicrobiaceae bacterium]
MNPYPRPHSSPRKLAFVCSAAFVLCLPGKAAAATGIIMPIFGNTTAQFNGAVAAAQKAPMIALINPNNGPGSSKVGGISANVSRLKAAGAKAAGYISTAYGATSLASVYSQIDRYVSWYGANGIFLDEMSDRSNKVSYYTSIHAYAKKKGLLVVGNPGTFVPVAYAAVADVLVTYEDPLSHGWNSEVQSSWTAKYAASKFGTIVNTVPSASMNGVVTRAISQHFGWVFATDAGGNDPFARAPSYLAAEAAYVRSRNGLK